MTNAPKTTRLQAIEEERLRRLTENPDFIYYLGLLMEMLAAYRQSLPVGLVSPEEIAVHNQKVGSIKSLLTAINLVPDLLVRLEKEAPHGA